MRSGTAASAVGRSRAIALGGVIGIATVLVVGSSVPASAATLADASDASDSASGIGGLVGIVAVGLGVLGLVFGILRQRQKRGEPVAPANQRVTIAAPAPAETAGGWATEPLALPTSAVPPRGPRPQQARTQPVRSGQPARQSLPGRQSLPTGQRLSAR